MNPDLRALLEVVAGDLRLVFEPLEHAAEDPRRLHALFAEIGWDLDGLLGNDVDLGPLVDALAQARNALEAARASVGTATDAAAAVDAVFSGVRQALQLVADVHDAVIAGTVPALDAAVAEAFALDLAQFLWLRFLQRRAPLVLQLGLLVGLILEERPPALSVGGRSLRVARARPALALARIVELGANAAGSMLAGVARTGGAVVTDFLADLAASFEQRITRFEAAAGRALDAPLELTLDLGSLRLSGLPLPLLAAGAAPVQIPLPIGGGLSPSIEIAPTSLALTWTMPAAASGRVPLFGDGGFSVEALGSADGCPRRGLTVRRTSGRVSLEAAGGLAIQLPLDVLGLDGDTGLSVCASLTVAPDGVPVLALDEATAGPLAVRLGGASGVKISGASVVLRGVVFPLPADPYATLSLAVTGSIELPGGSTCSVHAELDAHGFHVTSTATVELPGGVRLHPIGASPVLAATVAFGSDPEATFDVSAGVSVPHASGAQELALTGHLVIGEEHGAPVIRSASATSALVGSWPLADGFTVTGARAALAYDELAHTFSVGFGGSIEVGDGANARAGGTLAATLVFDSSDRENVQLDAVLDDAHVELFGQVRLFDADLHLEAASQPPGATLTLRNGRAGLFLRDGVTAPGADVDAFWLAVESVGGSLTAGPDDLTLHVATGTLLLPDAFVDAGGARPSVTLDGGPGLVLRVSGGRLHASATIALDHIGVRLPVDDGPSATIDHAVLVLADDAAPELHDVSGTITLPLPDDRVLAVAFSQLEWTLNGLPKQGRIALADDLSLPLAGGFELVFIGDPHGAGTGLTFTRTGDVATFVITAGARVVVPADVLTDVDGDRATFGGRATITVRTDALAEPALVIEELVFGSDDDRLHIGGANGLVLDGPHIIAEHVDALFADAPPQPFALTLSGTVICPLDGGSGRITLGIQEAQFTFTDGVPDFNFKQVEVGFGGPLFDTLPLVVERAAIGFKDAARGLPLDRKLRPEYLELGFGIKLQISLGSAGIGGLAEVDGVTVSLDDNGIPRVAIDGFGVGIQRLEIPGMGPFSGIVKVGSLTDLANLIFAGELQGSASSGMGVGALFAARMKQLVPGVPSVFMPLGVCLDVEGGSMGIPLGQTGFLLTGVSGGVSFANSNTSPCDIRAYFPDRPQPGPRGRETDDGSSPSGRPARNASGCPGDCPPLAMNILCQPHPANPQRAILKLSAIDEALLARAGVTRPWVRSLVPAGAANAGDLILDQLMGELRALLPVPPMLPLYPGPPPELEPILRDPVGYLVGQLRQPVHDAVAGITDPDRIYDLVKDLAYAGVPCPDATLQVTATLSYVGVSSFLSVTGGASVSTAGSVGVLGTLNVLGIPMGKARVFLTFTGPTGEPDPSLCGDVRFAVGPLELGIVGASYSIPGFIHGVGEAVRAAAAALPVAKVRAALEAVAADVVAQPGYDPDDPVASMAQLTTAQALSFATYLEQFPAAEIGDALVALATTVLSLGGPRLELCGRVAPRLFGIPLGGSLVEFYALATRDGFEGSLTFSPSGLINYFTVVAHLIAGGDEATLGFAVSVPDPAAIAADALRGRLDSPAAIAAYAEDGVKRLLRDGVFTVRYKLVLLGLELGDLVARVILPYLTPHPDAAASVWRSPDGVAGTPGRVDVLVAALDAHQLGDIHWKGDLTAGGQPTTGAGALQLQRDFFPHGGVVGAGELRVPRALLDAPPPCLATVLDASATTLDRLRAALTYVTDYLLHIEVIGSIGFYGPAPAPPFLKTPDGARDLTPAEVLDLVCRQQLDPATLSASPLLHTELAFLRGYVEGRLLGVPLARAEVAASGPSLGIPSGFATITAVTAPGSWVSRFVDARLEFRLRQRPERPVEERSAALRGIVEAAVTAAEAGGAPGDALDQLLDALAADLPKISLEASLNAGTGAFRMPPELAPWLAVDGAAVMMLAAYSPRYAPDTGGTGPVADAKRRGGIVLSGRFRFAFPGGPSIAAAAELSVIPGTDAAELPRLIGRVALASTIPLGGLTLRDAHLEIDSRPDAGQPLLALTGRLDPFHIGWFDVAPLPGRALAAAVELREVNGRLEAALRVQPARLRAPLFGDDIAVVLDGGADDKPFTFSTSAAWSVRATAAAGLAVLSPVDPTDPPLVRGSAAATGALHGTGLRSAQVDLTLGGAVAFPGIGGLDQDVGQLAISATSGRHITVGLRLHPLVFGRLRLHGAAGPNDDIGVHLTPHGLSFPLGLKLSIEGLTTSELRLRSFVANGRGDIRVTATGRTLEVAPWFHATGGSLRFRRAGGVARVSLTSPRLVLFPDTALATKLQLAAALAIDSSGDFQAHAEVVALPVGLFAFTGSLAIASAGGRMSVTATGALSLPLLPPISGAFSLAPDGFSLGSCAFGVAGLLECSASRWGVHWDAHGVTLQADAPAVLALGVAISPPRASIALRDTGYTIAVTAPTEVAILPGWLVAGAGSAFSLTSDRTGARLDASGRLQALPRLDGGGWLVDAPCSFHASGDSFAASLDGAPAFDLVNAPGILTVRVPRGGVSLVRSGGALSTRLHVDATLLGSAHAFDAALGSDGMLDLSWSGGSVPLGSLTLTFDDKTSVALNALSPAPAASVQLSSGKLSFPASWHVGDLAFAGGSIDTAAFSITADATQADWADLPGFDGWEYQVTTPKVTVSRSGTTFAASISGGAFHVRTKASVDGHRMADKQIDLPGAAIGSNGRVTIDLPPLGIDDVHAGDREDCINSYVGGHDNPVGVAACYVQYPQPPPPLHGNATLDLSALLD